MTSVHTLIRIGAALAVASSAFGCIAHAHDATTHPDEDGTSSLASGREGDDQGWDATRHAALASKHPAAPHVLRPRPTHVGGDGTSPRLGAQSVDNGVGSPLLDEVIRELGDLDPASSFYAHDTYVDESVGTRDVDCSGYVDYAMTYALPDAFAQVPSPGRRPLAKDWYALLASADTFSSPTGTHWLRVRSANDLQPGDLVAWKPPPGSTTRNTGHLMIVSDWPYAGRANELVVPISDSTENPHANDSRADGGSGPGTGSIGLKVDGNGEPVAYYWSGGVSRTAVKTAIVLGRLE
ncbi:MAG: hypothetical protein NVS3B10_13130 [Polyangiales bacterium]